MTSQRNSIQGRPPRPDPWLELPLAFCVRESETSRGNDVLDAVDFKWVPRYQYARGELALQLGRLTAAQLMRRLDGTWFVQLSPNPEPLAPLRMRPARSFDTGGRPGLRLGRAGTKQRSVP